MIFHKGEAGLPQHWDIFPAPQVHRPSAEVQPSAPLAAAEGGSWKREGKPEVFSSFLTAQLSLQHPPNAFPIPTVAAEQQAAISPVFSAASPEVKSGLKQGLFSEGIAELLHQGVLQGKASREEEEVRGRVSQHSPTQASFLPRKKAGSRAKAFPWCSSLPGVVQWDVRHTQGARCARGM